MDGITRPTFEIFEIAIVIMLFFIISAGILYTNKPSFNKAYLIITELGDINDIIGDGTTIYINYPENVLRNFKLIKNKGKLKLSLDDKTEIEKNVLNKNTEIIQDGNKIKIEK